MSDTPEEIKNQNTTANEQSYAKGELPELSDDQKYMLYQFVMEAQTKRVSILTDEQAKSRNMHIHNAEAFTEY